MAASRILRHLGDGLVLRRATPADTGELVEFNVRIHCEHNPDDTAAITCWTKDLMSGTHPTFRPQDFTVVEDTNTGKIVSSLNLISQQWRYAGIPFKLGRPELVGTDAAYRKRGLVRAQFEVIHEWSRQRGELAQAITGIPYFYRQFGYEMTLDLGGHCRGHVSQVPLRQRGEKEPYRVRPATAADVPFLTRTYEAATRRYLVSDVRPAAIWRYELTGRLPNRAWRQQIRVIETPERKAVGLLVHGPVVPRDTISVEACELVPGTNWFAVTPSVQRYLVETGESYAKKAKQRLEWCRFDLGVDHPVAEVLEDTTTRSARPYAYYLRVADVPALLRHLAPALETRLAASLAAGYTGTLRLGCYGSGASLTFASGRLVQVEALTEGARTAAAFPNHTLLHLLFGYRTPEEIKHLYADCSIGNAETRLLLRALFPKLPSHVWPIS